MNRFNLETDMGEVVWTKGVPKESGFYWTKWNSIGAEFPTEVDCDGSVWMIGSEVDHAAAGLLFGPRIHYLWESAQ